MKLHIFGDTSKPKILILHPLLLDGKTMYEYFKDSFPGYCIVAPDLGGHGKDLEQFLDVNDQADQLKEMLICHNLYDFDLLLGFCIGGRLALSFLHNCPCNFKVIYLDGVPAYRSAGLRNFITKRLFVSYIHDTLKNEKATLKQLQKVYGDLSHNIVDGLKKIQKASIYPISDASQSYEFFEYPDSLQKKLYFYYGKKEYDKRCIRALNTCYPMAHFTLRKGYDHCEYAVKDKEGFASEIKQLIQKHSES